jgi:hypothetical protein
MTDSITIDEFETMDANGKIIPQDNTDGTASPQQQENSSMPKSEATEPKRKDEKTI